MNLNSSVGEERYDISTDYASFVGANLFAHNSLSVRMNSHLPPRQLRNLGSKIALFKVHSFGDKTRDLITRAGFPTAMLYGGMSRGTTEPAPITAPSPTWTPGRIVEFPPIQTN